jgi:preprotein translocase subunit SecF
MILAGVCIVAAGFFLLRRELPTAFVIAVLGLIAWFLNYRAQMKEVIAAADLEDSSRRDEEESLEDSVDN